MNKVSTTLGSQTPLVRRPAGGAAISVLSWVVLGIAVVYFAFRGPIFPNGNRLWDYAVCASSSYLWLHGEDPFAWEAVKGSWLQRGGARGITPDISWLYAIVPPPTLAVLAPFAALPVAIGAYLYLVVTSVLTGIAAWVCGRWAELRGGTAWRFYCAAILCSVPASLGLYSGNPTMLATPMLLIGSYLAFRRVQSGSSQRALHSEWMGGALIGIGVACKMQMGLPVLALWVLLGKWRAALAAVLIAGLISGIAIARLALADVEWLASWVENVRKMTTEGGLNDYLTAKNPDDLLNLQVALVRLFGSRTATDNITFGVWILLGIILAVGIVRTRWGKQQELPLLCATGLLLLLPVYHRTYDAIVLLPLLALSIAGVNRDRWAWFQWVSIGLMASLCVPAGLPNYLIRRGILPALPEPSVLASAIIGHKGWCLLGLAVIWCIRFGLQSRQESGPMSQKNPDAGSGVA